MFGKSSNDTQENPKNAQKKEEELKKFQEENTELNSKITGLSTEKDKLERESKNLTKDKTDLTSKNAELQKQVKDLQDSKQVLENEKAKLTNENTKLKAENTELTNKITGLSTDKENLSTALSKAENQANQTIQKLNELEQKHAPYQKLEKLYEVFLEVKDRLNFNFVATTHSAMDLIVSVLSDSKYYLESLYNKASQELSDKRCDKGEKLAELFDLLFEYLKDSKFERLKEPSGYDSFTCMRLYPEQNASGKMRRVVLRGYKHNDKVYHTVVDMGS